MIGALVYLRVASLGNWLDRRIKRLRQPKYFIGAIVGLAYIWFFFIRPTQVPSPSAARMFPLTFGLATLGLFAVIRMVIAWLTPDKPGLGFTEAEIAFLFPAPLTRRTLVHYKLIGSQVAILLSAVIVVIVTRRWQSLGGNSVTHAVGWWLMMSVLSLHNIGAALTVARLNDRGIGIVRRQALVSAVILLYLGALVYGVWRAAPALLSWSDLIRVMHGNGFVGWLLLPFRALIGPFVAPTWRAFGLALGPALLVLAAHYLWVYKSEVSFEEASIARAEKRAHRIAAMQAGRFPRERAPTAVRHPPFRLDPAGGRPEIAFLWKNLLSTRSIFNHLTFLGAGMLFTAICFVLAATDARGPLRTFGALSVIAGAYTLLLGPQVARQDLRGDLINADVLKTYPLPGWRLVLGQLLAPTAILTGIIWLCLLPQAFALAFARSQPLPPAFVIAGGFAIAALAPLVCFIQLMIPNAAVLFFPSWAGPTRFRERGIDVMGQRMLFALAQFLVVLLALVPALGFGVLTGFAASLILPAPIAIAAGAIAGFAVLATEIVGGLLWIGRQFETFDLTAEPHT